MDLNGTRLTGALAALLLLAACGVDGAPVPPSEVEEEEATRTGITIGGSASAGVKGSF